jgi:hypothetical protein
VRLFKRPPNRMVELTVTSGICIAVPKPPQNVVSATSPSLSDVLEGGGAC